MDEENDEATVIDIDDICMTILEFLTRTGYNCSQSEFEESVKVLDKDTLKNLFDRVNTDSEDEDEVKCISEKLRLSLQTIWNVKPEVKPVNK